MTTEQKMAAMNAVSEASIQLTSQMYWYVRWAGVARKEDRMLSSGGISSPTPQAAVDNCWEWATDEKYYLVCHRAGKRCAVRWNTPDDHHRWRELNAAVPGPKIKPLLADRKHPILASLDGAMDQLRWRKYE